MYFTFDDFDAGNFDSVKKAAERGNVSAQYLLGVMYADGKGVEQNSDEARKWFEKAAEHGLPEAQCRMGLLYINTGDEQDWAVAHEWLMKAAEQGHAVAQYNLGVMYEGGWGVTVDYPEALRWFEMAAEQGYARAQCKVGELYFDGCRGIERDYDKAHEWLSKAVEQNVPFAMWNLAAMYCRGKGVEADRVKARKLLHKAALLGSSYAELELMALNHYEADLRREEQAIYDFLEPKDA